MKTLKKFYLLAFIGITITSCGFHLRNNHLVNNDSLKNKIFLQENYIINNDLFFSLKNKLKIQNLYTNKKISGGILIKLENYNLTENNLTAEIQYKGIVKGSIYNIKLTKFNSNDVDLLLIDDFSFSHNETLSDNLTNDEIKQEIIAKIVDNLTNSIINNLNNVIRKSI